jgi:hypothetical protein
MEEAFSLYRLFWVAAEMGSFQMYVR